MNGLRTAQAGLALTFVFGCCSQAMALPFSIFPVSNANFPTSINAGQPVNAVYIVTNTSGINLAGISLKSLPAGVTQVTSNPTYPQLCSATFSLNNGASCYLQLAVNTAVANSNNAYNAILSIPGVPVPTNQGFSLNIPSSGWTLIGSPTVGSLTGYIETLTSDGATIFAAGHSNGELSALWAYVNNVWTNVYQGTTQTTGAGSTFKALSFRSATQGYIGGHNDTYGKVYSLDTSTNPATVVDLNYQDSTFTTGGQPEYPTEVDSVLYSPQNNMLYIGGESNTDQINNYGVVYSYSPNNSSWTNLGLTNAIFVDSLAITGGNLYAAFVGQGMNFAEVYSYSLNGGTWSDTYLPSTIDEIHSLVVDANGVLYAGGYDDFGGTVWKYQAGQWSSLNFTGGSEVKTLSIGPNNVLYATGVNNSFGGGVWSYANGVWTPQNPASSTYVNSIAFLSGSPYIAGQDIIAEQCIWQG